MPSCLTPQPSVRPPARQVVEPPVERLVRELEGVLLDELFFRREQMRPQESYHRALDRLAFRQVERIVGVFLDERRRRAS